MSFSCYIMKVKKKKKKKKVFAGFYDSYCEYYLSVGALNTFAHFVFSNEMKRQRIIPDAWPNSSFLKRFCMLNGI